MPIEYIIILILICIFLLIFVYIEPMIAKHKIKNSNEYGSARFANILEIKRDFTKEKVSKVKDIGFPIIFDNKLENVWMDKETPHWVYLGSTGSGKSVTQVIPYCTFLSTAKNKRSAFITDPKGEIFSTTSKMFEDRGYRILTIDFRNPEKSNKFNVLEPIIKEWELYIENEKLASLEETDNIKTKYNNLSMYHYAETNRLITSLSDMIMKDKVEAKDPFWNNAARQLLEGIIGFFLEEYKIANIKRNQITMTSIRKFQNSSMEESNFKKFKSYLDTKEYGNKSKDSLTSVITASENTYKSITSVFGSKMNLFDDVNVANVTSSYDKEFDDIGNIPTILYVIVPDEDKTYFTLVTLIVGLLYKELVKVANKQDNKKLPVQIDWILDEFANCPPLSEIEAIVSVARSRGMRFHFFIQSFAQLDNVYGKEVAQIILDNSGLVYLKTNTQDSAEKISKILGRKTIESSSISQSVSLKDYNGNKSTSLMARDLLTPDEIKQLHYKMIIFPIIGYPVFRDTIIYNKFSSYISGTIKRKINNLQNLSNTYYTVEDIKYDARKKVGRLKKDLVTDETKKVIEDKINNDKTIFEDIEKEIAKVYQDTVYDVEYEERNYQTVLVIKSDEFLDTKDYIKLSSIYPEKYYIEFECVDNKQVINIHMKGLISLC